MKKQKIDYVEMSLDEYLAMEYQGNVYFVQAGKNGAIKIGYARDVKRRISILQISQPEMLNVLLTVQASKVDEKIMHSKFSKHRIRGEWFNPDSEILEFVNKLKSYGKSVVFNRKEYIKIIRQDGTITELNKELKDTVTN